MLLTINHTQDNQPNPQQGIGGCMQYDTDDKG